MSIVGYDCLSLTCNRRSNQLVIVWIFRHHTGRADWLNRLRRFQELRENFIEVDSFT